MRTSDSVSVSTQTVISAVTTTHTVNSVLCISIFTDVYTQTAWTYGVCDA